MKATYVSVWDFGQVRTSCEYDPATGIVSDIETSDTQIEDGCLEREFIELADGTEIVDFTNEDGQIFENGECIDDGEEYDDSMDGDHASGLASAGWGTDEDYGGPHGEDDWLDGSYEE